MGIWSLGSVADFVYDVLDSVPDTISGTRLLQISDQQREFVETYTGLTIGSNSIDIKFQSIISNLAAAKTAEYMNTLGGDAESYKIGDFSVKKGGDTNLVKTSQGLKRMAMEELNAIGRKSPHYKANG